MKVSQGMHCWLEYHNLHSKKNSLKTYQSIFSKLKAQFGERDLNSLPPEEILSFLTHINQGTTKGRAWSSIETLNHLRTAWGNELS